MKQLFVSFKGHTVVVPAQVVKDQVWFQWEGQTFSVPLKAPGDREGTRKRQTGRHKPSPLKSPAPSSVLKGDRVAVVAPVPGKVWEVLVKPDQVVKKNQALFVLSSMKMEHTLHSPCTGQVKLLKIKAGDFVKGNEELAQIQSS